MLLTQRQIIIITAALLSPVSSHAVSSTGTVKDYCIPSSNGKVTKAQVAVATRRGFKGVSPKITARPSAKYPNCFDSRFMHEDELKHVSFNCTGSKLVLSPQTR